MTIIPLRIKCTERSVQIMEKSKGEITREHVLDAALELINTRGFAGTSMSDIIEATGVKKGNLYFHFSSKEDLVYALIKKARDEFNAYIAKHTRGNNAREKIFAGIEALFRFHKKRNFVGGCIFGNTALEMGDNNPRFEALIRNIFNGWIDNYALQIRNGQIHGDIPGNLDPESTARHIVATLEGAIMLTRISKDPSHYRDCIDSLKHLLGGDE